MISSAIAQYEIDAVFSSSVVALVRSSVIGPGLIDGSEGSKPITVKPVLNVHPWGMAN